MSRGLKAQMTLAGTHVRYWTKADKVGFWRKTTCPLMTQCRHRIRYDAGIGRMRRCGRKSSALVVAMTFGTKHARRCIPGLPPVHALPRRNFHDRYFGVGMVHPMKVNVIAPRALRSKRNGRL